MSVVAISIVNLNCLQHTKNLIGDLDRQTYSDFEIYVYNQNSSEPHTDEFLRELDDRPNYTVIQTGENKPLNHIWNDFSNRVGDDVSILTFLNNDIRITANYLEDSVNVLNCDQRIGIAVHATNNRQYSTATVPTRHIMEGGHIKQGWEFSLRKNDWKNIPEILQFYCGDDFIFNHIYSLHKKSGTITSSPVIHKLSQTRQAMGEEFTVNIKKQALEDIENYKKLGFTHVWNNISKYSKLNQELKQITELNTEVNICKFAEYKKRLVEHLNDCKNVDGIILDVGVTDDETFSTLLDATIRHNKKLIGIDLTECISGDIVSNSIGDRPSDRIRSKISIQNNKEFFTIHRNGFLPDMKNLSEKISFAFVGVFNQITLRIILPKLWELIESGGTLFFPYYHYNTCPKAKQVIDEFFADKKFEILCSRMQTIRNNRDTYITIKSLKTAIPHKRRTLPLTVACVLKTPKNEKDGGSNCGGIYDAVYVNKLASAIQRHLKVDYKFVCLTDVDEKNFNHNLVDEVIPLKYNLRGWWSKMELFRPELFNNEQVLYFDLDTLITDDMEDFGSYGGDFMALRDFNTLVGISSGVMGWNAKVGYHLFYEFINGIVSGTINMEGCVGGDQQIIEQLFEGDVDWIQDIFPNKMAAFHYQCYDAKTNLIHVPEKTSIICFHGTPKMADLIGDPVIQFHWN